MSDVAWLDERQARAWQALQQMIHQLNGELARRLAATSELSYQDYAVLVVLTDAADGRQRPFELGRDLGWEKSRLSHHLARMVQRGLVVSERCETDGRGSVIGVTAQGRHAIAAAAPGHVGDVRQLFVDALAPALLDAVGDAAEAVLERLRDVGRTVDGDCDR